MTHRNLVTLAASLVLLLAWPFAVTAPQSGEAGAAGPDWIPVSYAELVDRRELSHSGDSVGELLDRLAANPEDPTSLMLLDPLLEPYAFVLQDTLDTRGAAPMPPMVEVGFLWLPGEAQPAWNDLLRARRYLVESDGAGNIRICLPAAGTGRGASRDSDEALRRAIAEAWPVLRHFFSAESRRLAAGGAESAGKPELRVEFHVYGHRPESSTFLLGARPLRLTVTDSRPRGLRPPLDLQALRRFLESGMQLEGARLEADGSLQLLGSAVEQAPSVLGRALTLGDLAVAYRAIFHGGLSEPYMSLDRGNSPQTSVVNYGGRLRDTALGMVSLLCDIRFKTFSQGLGIEEDRDLRKEMRAVEPSFRTHLERFSADPGAAGVLAQQTRLWFYPDSVDLTVSAQTDVLAFRRVRMTASSERIVEAAAGGSAVEDPPWTRQTVDSINQHYDELALLFPEMSDLDQVVRLLSLFTWLKQAESEGLLVPDLDALLAAEVPPQPTPRVYPQLLAFNALPPTGGEGGVVTFDRVAVADALERLNPSTGRQLPARRRLERARASLDPGQPRNAALIEEIRSIDLDRLDGGSLDRLAHRVERLRMHQTVLSTVDSERRDELVARQQAGEKLRIFSVGIGGLDLGMGRALSRARGRSLQLASRSPAPPPAAGTRGVARDTEEKVSSAAAEPREAWRLDAADLPVAVLPDHGVGSRVDGSVRSSDGSQLIEIVAGATESGASGRSTPGSVLVVLDADGAGVRSRRLFLDTAGRAGTIERLEGARFLTYRMFKSDDGWEATRAEGSPSLPAGSPDGSSVLLPAGLATLELGPATAGTAEARGVLVRMRGPGATRPMEADFPRGLLQRVVIGPEADRAPGRALSGFDPLPTSLGAVETVMVLARPEQSAPPWIAGAASFAGEEDPLRIARSLGEWWSDGAAEEKPAAIVGTDGTASVRRWSSAPALSGSVPLLLPRGAFPGPARRMRDELQGEWGAGPVIGELSDQADAKLIILISAEAPDLLAARLRRLARLPAMRGKLLAVWSLAGPLRQDLPAALLDEGQLAGFGLGGSTLVSRRVAVGELDRIDTAISGVATSPLRVEQLRGPFLWFF